MKLRLLLLVYTLSGITSHLLSQQIGVRPMDSTKVDYKYREDQFYAGLTFNLLINTPIDQSGFSGGIHLGFIRDMPINKKRNVAFGLGLGYSGNTYNQSLYIDESTETENSIFLDLDVAQIDYDTNRFITHLLEVPLQFRWRTSQPQSHKFWRVYTGLQLGYIYYFKSTYVSNNGFEINQTKLEELDRLRYGATLSIGWNTFNFYLYYSLNSFFDRTAITNENPIDINTLKFGLIFYIL